mmetsp:Transcript_636/g.2330  ORF Transcript_636/g.2330 Transcript_636/m.2330 type:complete len:230 (+) Transcript_636:362-1051(+)
MRLVRPLPARRSVLGLPRGQELLVPRAGRRWYSRVLPRRWWRSLGRGCSPGGRRQHPLRDHRGLQAHGRGAPDVQAGPRAHQRRDVQGAVRHGPQPQAVQPRVRGEQNGQVSHRGGFDVGEEPSREAVGARRRGGIRARDEGVDGLADVPGLLPQDVPLADGRLAVVQVRGGLRDVHRDSVSGTTGRDAENRAGAALRVDAGEGREGRGGCQVSGARVRDRSVPHVCPG